MIHARKQVNEKSTIFINCHFSEHFDSFFQLFPSYQAYVSEPAHLAHLQSSQSRNNAFSMSGQIRQVRFDSL